MHSISSSFSDVIVRTATFESMHLRRKDAFSLSREE